jgi:hypothetical protein
MAFFFWGYAENGAVFPYPLLESFYFCHPSGPFSLPASFSHKHAFFVLGTRGCTTTCELGRRFTRSIDHLATVQCAYAAVACACDISHIFSFSEGRLFRSRLFCLALPGIAGDAI